MFPDSLDIKNDLNKRGSHLVQQPDSFEFFLPQETNLNRPLFHNSPTGNVDENGKISKDGKFGIVRYYYIPKIKHTSLVKLFQQFKIPENLYDDLIGAYLNMFFAKWTSSYSTEFEHNFHNEQNNLSDALIFLSELAQGKINITKISMEYLNVTLDSADPIKLNNSDKKKKGFQGTMPVSIFEEALKLYESVHNYNMFKLFSESSKDRSKLETFMGHKNAEKQSQSYYSFAIFEYLTKTLFSGAADLYFNCKLNEYKALVRKHSKRQRYLFIGKLIVLSELDEEKDDELLIDSVLKRVRPYRSESRKK
jgi:hypothetical protein